MINYTKEQQECIDYFDSDLLISASAGSGKTQVLLEKVIKLLDSGYKLDEILMVTFTNLASSEMKSKLENMLIDKIDSANSNTFFNALQNINTCDISTLHSFCQKIIREYYYALNIEPDFEIREESFFDYLKNNALNETIKEFLNKNDEDFIKLSNLFVQKRNYNLFKEEILNFYTFLVSKLDKYIFVNDLINSNYNTNLNENKLITEFRIYVLKNINSFKNQLIELKQKAQKIKSLKLQSLIDSFYTNIDFNLKNNESFIKTFSEKIIFPQIRISNNAEIEEIELKEELQVLSQQIKKSLKSINDILGEEEIEVLKIKIKASKNLLIKLIDVVKTFEYKFKNLKKQNNALDFNDLEELTLKLFENKQILKEISNKYKFIFVDEYQDTNTVQEKILSLLCENSKRIMVGDLKQSIYAFRECNPKIFNDKMHDFEENKTGKVIKLNKNFRSNEKILNFSNDIFSNLMREENASYNYEKDGKFVCGRKDEEKTEKPIEILCLDKASEDLTEVQNQENILVLNSINNLLNKEICDGKVKRKLTFSDIAIISRKRNEKVKNLCKFLQENKVPINVKYYEKIYSLFEIKLILAYLKIINNIDNEISLYSVLKNIYNFSVNELIAIKNNSLSGGVLEYNQNDAISTKIKEFLRDYKRFKEFSFELSVKELIEKIVFEKNLDILLMKTFGKISASRISVFINSIPKNLFSISEFLSFCENLADKKFEIKVLDSEDSVIVDTFHSTKGLEYNAVIIFDAGTHMFSKNTSSLIYNAKFGIGIFDFNEVSKTKSPNLVYSIIKILNKQEEFNEEVRLSYVAFTRAKNFMHIIGCENVENLKREKNILNFLNFNSYLNLIFSSEINLNDVNIQIVQKNSKIFKNSINAEEQTNTFVLDYERFDKLFNKEYNYQNSCLLQLKNSVTALSEEDKYIYNISNLKLTDNDSEDYLELGNAYHYSLEKLPFNLNSTKEVRNKMVNLIENKLLPENVYNYVNDEKLLKAIQQIRSLIDQNDKVYKEQVFMFYAPYNSILESSLKDKVLVQGVIDLYIEKENEIILIDYKTSRLNDYKIIKKYSMQLSLYEKALKEKYNNKKITKFIYSIFLDKLINVV